MFRELGQGDLTSLRPFAQSNPDSTTNGLESIQIRFNVGGGSAEKSTESVKLTVNSALVMSKIRRSLNQARGNMRR